MPGEKLSDFVYHSFKDFYHRLQISLKGLAYQIWNKEFYFHFLQMNCVSTINTWEEKEVRWKHAKCA